MPLTARQKDRLLEGFRELVAELDEHPRYRILLPNLRIPMCYIAVLPNEIRIDVDVLNDGLATSGECDLSATVTVIKPGTPPGAPQQPVVRCPKLPPGGIKRFRPFHAFPNPGDGHFVNVALEVDPPTAARPGGEVWESNETDNQAFCGVFTTRQEPEELPDTDRPSVPFGRPTPPRT
jgi:hypothetical protein